MKEYKYKINGNEYKVTINNVDGEKVDLEVNGTAYQVDILIEKKKEVKPTIKRPAALATAPAASPKPAPASAGTSASGGKAHGIKAPLPGVILDISVKVGDEVKRGQKVAVLEAMKMENSINADRDGKVLEIKVNKGDSILEGSDIVVIG